MRVAANIETPPEIAARGLRMLVLPCVAVKGAWLAIAYRDAPWRHTAHAYGSTREDAAERLLGVFNQQGGE